MLTVRLFCGPDSPLDGLFLSGVALPAALGQSGPAASLLRPISTEAKNRIIESSPGAAPAQCAHSNQHLPSPTPSHLQQDCDLTAAHGTVACARTSSKSWIVVGAGRVAE